MNLAKLENLLHAGLAFSFAVGLLFVVAPPARADAADDWAAYRQARGLPVTAEPSAPGERSAAEGPAPEARLVSLEASVGGEGNGNGHEARSCDPFLVELAKSDGDTRGETARCK